MARSNPGVGVGGRLSRPSTPPVVRAPVPHAQRVLLVAEANTSLIVHKLRAFSQTRFQLAV